MITDTNRLLQEKNPVWGYPFWWDQSKGSIRPLYYFIAQDLSEKGTGFCAACVCKVDKEGNMTILQTYQERDPIVFEALVEELTKFYTTTHM